MVSPKLYKSSHVYDFFIKALGYENAIDRFLRDIEPSCPPDGRILDVGCGTGLLGLHFLKRFPKMELTATDLEPNFLKATLDNAASRGIESDRISVGVADISSPRSLTKLNGESITLEEASFAIICVGAAVGYANDTEDSIRQLIKLLQPGGCLINVEMNESLSAKFVAHRYHYHNIPLTRMLRLIRDEGCDVSTVRLKLSHLPAGLTRIGIVARKSVG